MLQKKLFARAIGPYPIMPKLGSKAYLPDSPNHYSTSLVFNVKDLLPYKGMFESLALSSSNIVGIVAPKESPLAHGYEVKNLLLHMAMRRLSRFWMINLLALNMEISDAIWCNGRDVHPLIILGE
ncbi:hypothetical protein SLEP1_g3323 [Rubroshorea leprosula]|uniref:Tf2-1-like SH3-like domain-containing protein n=1 Tax=Rubroshorea leprosula TaxID=152421 RepID=A0AAV5HPC2_9ROSI|nr:hypothetical protein SLEP1_g3323 [Rubroshorea leprosula]